MSTAEHVDGESSFSRDDFLSFLLDRGLVGLAWADPELVIKGTVGKLSWWMTAGDHITQDLAPFVGLEDELNELMDDFRPSLVLSNVGMNVEVADSEKTSIEVFWQDKVNLFVIVLHRLGGQPEFEEDMARQLRGRRLAEENIAAMQRQIQETQGLLDIIAERSPVGLAVQDLEKKYSFVTKRWLEQLEVSTDTSSIPHDASFSQGVSQALQGHESQGWPKTAVVDDEATSVDRLAWRHRPWFDASGAVAGVVSAVHPLTELIGERDRLQRQVTDLERVNTDLEAFSAMLAHDVRAPLAALRTRLVQDETISASPNAISEIDTTLARIHQMTDGLLEFATGSGTSGPVHAVDLEAMVRRIAEECTSGTGMVFEIVGDWPVVRTAVAPLDIILRNLVQNAARHHDQDTGKVRVSVKPQGTQLCIEVSDDGPGIAPEYHQSILIRLKQAQGARPARLGLVWRFVKRAAKSLNARIELDSDPQRARGSIFRLIWPVTG